jgi:NCS1 family nucleobase:cation symporter-1
VARSDFSWGQRHAAIIVGNIIGVVLTALATTPVAGRYGVEQFVSLRSRFGYNGSRLVYVLAVIVLTMGWLAVLAIMFGRSIDGLVALTQGTEASPPGSR